MVPHDLLHQGVVFGQDVVHDRPPEHVVIEAKVSVKDELTIKKRLILD
jgi:hypothetical protein